MKLLLNSRKFLRAQKFDCYLFFIVVKIKIFYRAEKQLNFIFSLPTTSSEVSTRTEISCWTSESSCVDLVSPLLPAKRTNSNGHLRCMILTATATLIWMNAQQLLRQAIHFCNIFDSLVHQLSSHKKYSECKWGRYDPAKHKILSHFPFLSQINCLTSRHISSI